MNSNTHKETRVIAEKFRSIRQRLIIWFMLLALLPLFGISWFNYHQSKTSLSLEAADKLQQSASLSVAYLTNWFENRKKDISSQAESYENVTLVQQLTLGLASSQLSLDQYIKSFDWVRRVDNSPNSLVSLSRRYDYIHDILLIGNKGNVLYSVEKKSDWGTNLFHGAYTQTNFAQIVRNTLSTGEVGFSDLERYYPGDTSLVSFMTAPLLNDLGDKIGVIAVQLSLDRLFNILGTVSSQHSSLHQYLVGRDGYLRTPLKNGDWREVLARDVQTEQFVNWLKQDLLEQQANSIETTVLSYTGPEGVAVIGQYHNTEIFDLDWVLVSEVNQEEALQATEFLRYVMTIVMVAVAALVSAIAVFQARRITKPIANLASVVRVVAKGDTEKKVSVESNDEIGLLAESFNQMLDVRRQYIGALEDSNIEAKAALTKLADQQYALDQHAIVAVTDVSGTIIFANELFAKISGYSQGELLGKNHRILNSGHHDRAFFTDMYKTITNGKVWQGDICNKAKDGRIYWVASSIIPFLGEDGKPKSYIAIRNDITEKKLADDRLREALDALKEKQALLEQEEEIAKHVFSNITASNNDVIPELRSWSQPMGAFSGDMVLSSQLADGGLRIVLCDFTGHGLPAALGAVPVSSIYTAITAKGLPLEILMEELNNKLDTLLPTGIFCCIVGIDINAVRDQAQVWNAGLPEVLLVDKAGKIKQRVLSTHLPLGVMKYQQDEMEIITLDLDSEDSVYIYSDGLTEAETPSGEMLGQDQFEQILAIDVGLEGRLDIIKIAVEEFANGAAPTDDISLIEIKTLAT
ncbi:hypothetical protein A9Q78_11165 [Methylophaga sp. 41_12_T18]|nr:hypothetical protein A9Q78_11165 [Methylophaga sp. 41_12_T18]